VLSATSGHLPAGEALEQAIISRGPADAELSSPPALRITDLSMTLRAILFSVWAGWV